MAMLTLRHSRRFYEPRLPHLVFVDGLYAGTMQGDEMQLSLPAGRYQVRVQFGGRVPLGRSGRGVDLSVSSTLDGVEVRRASTLCFHDRERVWNLLFDLDLALWVVSLFVPLPKVFKLVSDLFFAVWIVRIVLIRKRYYRMTVSMADGLGSRELMKTERI